MTTQKTREEKRKAYHKAYNQRPEVKAHKKAYNQRPEVKAHKKAYKKDNFIKIPNCKGKSTLLYTDGVTKEMKKQLPKLMNKVALKLLWS